MELSKLTLSELVELLREVTTTIKLNEEIIKIKMREVLSSTSFIYT